MKAERQEYEGHVIELRKRDDREELLIDNTLVHYGQLLGGLYFLHDYAYDWSDNLVELARKFMDYRRKVENIRKDRDSRNHNGYIGVLNENKVLTDDGAIDEIVSDWIGSIATPDCIE
jgi:hypothetical protein